MSKPADARKQAMIHPQVQAYWQQVDCGFQQVADIFEECVYEALSTFSREQMKAWLEAARAPAWAVKRRCSSRARARASS